MLSSEAIDREIVSNLVLWRKSQFFELAADNTE
jgi:hypothetical protein